MYTQSVYVENISEDDHEELFKIAPVLRTINLPITDEMVARFKAIYMVNGTLPVHEGVSEVLSSVSDNDGGFIVRVKVLD